METVFSKIWHQVTTIDYNLKVFIVKKKLCKINGNILLKNSNMCFTIMFLV